MDDDIRNKIEGIIGGLSCPKQFKCVSSDFQQLCQAQDIGMDDFLVCLEPDSTKCVFALTFGYGHLCRCPLRVFLAKRLRK